MSDLISRADAIEAVVSWTVEDRPTEEMPTDLVDRIKALPSANVIEFDFNKYQPRVWNKVNDGTPSTEAVQGEWVDWLGSGNEWECSVCKCSVESHGSIAYKYCPMCGARMKGGAE